MVLLKRIFLLVLLSLIGIFASMSLMGEDMSEAGASAEKEIQGLASADFAEAYRLYIDKKYSESIRLFKAILHNPINKPYHDLAQLYIIRANVMSGHHVLLEADCNQFLGRYPDSSYVAEVVYVLGRYYFSVNAYKKTVLEYSSFLGLNKDTDFEFKIPLTFWLGEAYLKLGKENQASTNYLYVIAEAPMDDPVGWRATAKARMAELAQKHQQVVLPKEVSKEPEVPVTKEDSDLLRADAMENESDTVEAPILPGIEEPVNVAEAEEISPSGVDMNVDDSIASLPADLPIPEEDVPEAVKDLPVAKKDVSEVADIPTEKNILPDTVELDKLKGQLEKIQRENDNIKEMVKIKERLMDLKLYYMEQRVQK